MEEKCNSNNLFKKENNNIVSVKKEEIGEVDLVQYNESLFKKIWNRILKFCKKR